MKFRNPAVSTARLLIVVALMIVALGTRSTSADAVRISNSSARTQVYNAGMTVYSSGGCQTRSISTCTSLEQVHQHTINGIITLKNASGCSLVITGGTEVGHASGTYSHYNGYKLDIRKNACIDGYVTRTFTYIGGSKYQSAAGNIYYNEGDHWDILYY